MKLDQYFNVGSKEHKIATKLVEDFIHWRANKSTLGRTIPQDLWLSAANLAIEINSIKRVVVLLSLDYVALKKLVTKLIEDRCANSSSVTPVPSKEPKNRTLNKGNKRNKAKSANSALVSEHGDFISSVISSSFQLQKDKTFSAKPSSNSLNDFVEAQLSGFIPISKPLETANSLVAQITSCDGFTLNLFTHEATSLIKAFIRP